MSSTAAIGDVRIPARAFGLRRSGGFPSPITTHRNPFLTPKGDTP
jgi:hypothetical protein